MNDIELIQHINKLNNKLNRQLQQVSALRQKSKTLTALCTDANEREAVMNVKVTNLLERQRELNEMLNRANNVLAGSAKALAESNIEFEQMVEALPEDAKSNWTVRVSNLAKLSEDIAHETSELHDTPEESVLSPSNPPQNDIPVNVELESESEFEPEPEPEQEQEQELEPVVEVVVNNSEIKPLNYDIFDLISLVEEDSVSDFGPIGEPISNYDYGLETTRIDPELEEALLSDPIPDLDFFVPNDYPVASSFLEQENYSEPEPEFDLEPISADEPEILIDEEFELFLQPECVEDVVIDEPDAPAVVDTAQVENAPAVELTRICPRCGREVRSHHAACPICYAPMQAANRKQTKSVLHLLSHWIEHEKSD